MGSQNLHATLDVERHSVNVNVFFAVVKRLEYGTSFSEEPTVTGHAYQEMFINWLLPSFAAEGDDSIF